MEAALSPRSLAERPQVREYLSRNPASLIGDSDYDVMISFTDENLDWGRLDFSVFWFLYDCLNGITQQLSNDVLQVS